ncbi:MAG: amino acid ABC transporter permease [Oscillospiraceae bacterium]|jgi:His/Glu/Gln/Arg/opine family amino acid ABC transporter permease subunit|nr:amino acid ABC transporter permease [Oscillospiraceae bacterium]
MEAFWGTLQNSFERVFIVDDRWTLLARGLGLTLLITLLAALLGLVLGFLIAIVRSTHDKMTGLKPVPRAVLNLFNGIAKLYLTVIRGTPVVVQLMIIYFVVFGAVNISKVLVAVIAFGINSGAYVAEIVRSGIMSIERGQMEAGRSLGFSYAQTMVRVILPQAFKNVLPSLGNEIIVLLKETSVSGYIALEDLAKGGDIIRSVTYMAFMPLIVVALVYLTVVIFLSHLVTRLERRLRASDH